MKSISTDSLRFDPQELLRDYLAQNYDALSQKLIDVLEHFEHSTYIEMTPESQYFVNAFIKNFLYVFTQADYILSDRFVPRFISLNLTISNLVAISDFKNTDPYLEILKFQPQNYAKILTLFSARNSFQLDRDAIFAASPELACLWYSYYLEIYRTGLVSRVVYHNLREHINFEHEKLIDFYQIDDLYFGATYIDGDRDHSIKHKLNRSIQNSKFVKEIKVVNQPNPRKIAIISALWFPQHSVYRALAGCIAALKDEYELTLIHLGDRQIEVDAQYFHEVKYLKQLDQQWDLSVIQNNDFMAIYYPDIGMSAESIILSNIRIAPIQICGLGHPVSTCGSEIDYFISGAEAEVSRNPEANYSERLVLLSGIGAVNSYPNYQRSPSPSAVAASSLRPAKEQPFIINCPWYAHKVNYPLLLILKKIMQGAKLPLLFRFFSGGGLMRKNDFIPFVKDIENVLGAEGFEVVPYREYVAYMSMMSEGNLCLDSYHFGGFNVVVDGLYLQKPAILFEGKRWYNRAGARLFKKLGLGELVAKTPSEYTQLALKMINSPDFYAEIQSRIDQIDFDRQVFHADFQANNSQCFLKAMNFLIQNHDVIQADLSNKPIHIAKIS
ncbi:MAG: hypothetical protein NW214_14120 [Pseudanabaenaceae cyanobacterium bins.39]|nr:hypothetical protein [Pseudanabaenaceae cyanobacterium bins.39]